LVSLLLFFFYTINLLYTAFYIGWLPVLGCSETENS
jgi:hypothetical protein